jgi:hypothetical protein
MVIFDQGLGDLVGSVTSLKGRSDHGGKIHHTIMVDNPTPVLSVRPKSQ